MCSVPEARAVLIIPALNEEAVIGATLSRLPPGLFHRVIVADNGSTDRTAEVARAHGAEVVFHPTPGYGAACMLALASLVTEPASPHCVYAVVFLQADLSEDPAQAARLLEPLYRDQADFVLGSRTMGRPDPGALLPHQRFGNWLATTLIGWLYQFRYTDLGPFRAIRLDALRRLRMQDRDYGWTVEMQVRAVQEGLRILEVPVTYHCRAAGVNKVSGQLGASLKAGAKILSVVFRLWWREQWSARTAAATRSAPLSSASPLPERPWRHGSAPGAPEKRGGSCGPPSSPLR